MSRLRQSLCGSLALLALACQSLLGLDDYSFEPIGTPDAGTGGASAGGGEGPGVEGLGGGSLAGAGSGKDGPGGDGSLGLGADGGAPPDGSSGAGGSAPDGGVVPPDPVVALVFAHYSFTRGTAPYTVSAEVGLLERAPELQAVRAESLSTERGGTLDLAADGSFSYAPASDLLWGDDHAVFHDADGADAGLVRLTLQPGVVSGLSDMQELGNGFAVSGAPRVVDDSSERYTGEDLDRAGDVNGDGLDDFIVSGSGLSRIFVVFGKRDSVPLVLPNRFESMPASAGFVIDAGAVGWSSVSGAGDVNGDGFDDVVIGTASSPEYGAFVVFGSAAPETVTLPEATAGRTAVVRIYRSDTGTEAAGVGRFASAAGDVNGDGFDDFILGGSELTNPSAAGVASYVIFGSAAFESVTLLRFYSYVFQDSNQGFAISGGDVASGGVAGGDVARGAGDVNGDGLSDLVIGSPGYQSNASGAGGAVFVVFGKKDDLSVALADVVSGQGGFVIYGPVASDGFANAVSGAGDVNGDGLADVVIGAPYSAGPDFESDYGAGYVVFGKRDGASVSVTAMGASGFGITSPYLSGGIGYSVSGGGDFNGDGLSDIVLGSMTASVLGNSGAGFVVFGKRNADAVAIASLEDGQLAGVALAGTSSARTFVASAGDLNRDGLDDVLVAGAWSDAFSGRIYALFGWDASDRLQERRGILAGGRGDDTLDFTGTPLIAMRGGDGFDTLRFSGAGLELDLRGGAAGVEGIEHIDLRGGGDDTLWLDDLAVRRPGLPGGLARTLVLSGNAGDRVLFDLTGYSPGPSNAGRDVWLRDGGVYGLEATPGLIEAP